MVSYLDRTATPLLSKAARPRVADWLARVKARASFKVAIAAWAPAPILQLFRSQGEAVWSEVEPLTKRG
jgi:glutathione S-transferase